MSPSLLPSFLFGSYATIHSPVRDQLPLNLILRDDVTLLFIVSSSKMVNQRVRRGRVNPLPRAFLMSFPSSGALTPFLPSVITMTLHPEPKKSILQLPLYIQTHIHSPSIFLSPSLSLSHAHKHAHFHLFILSPSLSFMPFSSLHSYHMLCFSLSLSVSLSLSPFLFHSYLYSHTLSPSPTHACTPAWRRVLQTNMYPHSFSVGQ